MTGLIKSGHYYELLFAFFSVANSMAKVDSSNTDVIYDGIELFKTDAKLNLFQVRVFYVCDNQKLMVRIYRFFVLMIYVRNSTSKVPIPVAKLYDL